MVHSVLKQLGYTVIAAEQAKDALETVQSGNTPIDLLITDVIMPVMNGRELAERIQAVRPGIRCLYMSGYTADVIAQHGVLDAERQFLAKPFSIMDLARKVRAVLDG